ncbi:glycoside hydrolase, partial [Aureobasidium melanogenum]
MPVPHVTLRNGDVVMSGILVEGSADVGDVRVCLLQTIVHDLEAVRIGDTKPIFVTNFDEVDLERLRVSISDTSGTPIGGVVAHAILKLVQSFLQDLRHLPRRIRSTILSIDIQREASIDSQNRFDFHSLSPFKVFKQTKTLSVVVVPVSNTAGAVLKRAKSLPPLPSLSRTIAFQIVTSGEPQELGVEIVEALSNVRTKTILVALECLREHRDQIEIKGLSGNLSTIESNGKSVVGIGSSHVGMQSGFQLLEIDIVAFRGKSIWREVLRASERGCRISRVMRTPSPMGAQAVMTGSNGTTGFSDSVTYHRLQSEVRRGSITLAAVKRVDVNQAAKIHFAVIRVEECVNIGLFSWRPCHRPRETDRNKIAAGECQSAAQWLKYL